MATENIKNRWYLAHRLDGFVIAALFFVPVAVIKPQLLLTSQLPTGGDTASQVYYAYQFARYFPERGLTQWLPEVFCGLPFLSYYFPLPFIVIFLLDQVMPFAVAVKWGMFLASFITPASVYGLSVFFLRMSRFSALFGSIAAMAFLLHEQNSIWGGNLLAVLSGEFAYSYGMLFSLLTIAVWIKALQGRYFWLLGVIFEAAAGFSHGYALLVTGFSSFFLLFGRNTKESLGFLMLVHGTAFCLLAGWLWPLLEMHNLTIANDAPFAVNNWRDLLPLPLWPVYGFGMVSLLFLIISRSRPLSNPQICSGVTFMLAAALLAWCGWLSSDFLGLADIRFFPYVWLYTAIGAGWLIGVAIERFPQALHMQRRKAWQFGAALLCLVFMGFLLSYSVWNAPNWSKWNHAGSADKPQWSRLSALFPLMSGRPDSSRLIFEHDPANNDLGSTRALETLPYYLNGRPVLEGLYMESALLGPVIYQVQSEISVSPSSPLVRFPSGSLNPIAAAEHMELLHTEQVLIRSDKARAAIEASGLFIREGESPPFSVYRLKRFDSRLVDFLRYPAHFVIAPNWLEHAFDWFKNYPNVKKWPVYLPAGTSDVWDIPLAGGHGAVRISHFERERLVFQTTEPGKGHLIKMAYHPRWQLRSPGKLYLAAPGFMLVVPETTTVDMVYGATPANNLGLAASLSTMLFIIGSLLFRLTSYRSRVASWSSSKIWRGFVLWALLFLTLGAWLWLHSPERLYQSAWQYFRQNRYAEAAQLFNQSVAKRRSRSKQEESLFWTAKAWELAGDRARAKDDYRQLCERFSGYWLPESLYTLARLERLDGRLDRAVLLENRLRKAFPAHQFTRQLDSD